MSRPRKETVRQKFSAKPEQIDTLMEVAKTLGYTRVDKGSISLLLQAIAEGEVLILKKGLTK